MDDATAHAAYLDGRGVFVDECSLLWIEGPDAGRFLQGLLTNDVLALGPSESCPALLLNEKGHIQAGMTVHRDSEEGFTLVLDSNFATEVSSKLSEFHFSEDLEILGPELAGRIAVAEGVSHPQVDIKTVGRLPSSNDLIVGDVQAFLAESDLTELPPHVFHILRVENGVPLIGVDTNSRTLVQEAGLQDVAVSFSKGCYLGQETVARVAHRGAPRKRLAGLTCNSLLPLGGEVTHADRAIGRITSAIASPAYGPIALARLRVEASTKSVVAVAGRDARIEELPFGRTKDPFECDDY